MKNKKIHAAYHYLQYKIIAKHKKGHSIHSPFIFNFVIDVLSDSVKPNYFLENRQHEKILLQNGSEIEIIDYGAGSSFGNRSIQKIKNNAKNSATPWKYRCLLAQISNYYKPELVVELGTSMGLTTSVLANSTKHKVITVEGSESIYKVALANFQKWKNQNIVSINAQFDDFIATLNSNSSKTLIYIDGNHRYKSTIDYVNTLWSKIPDGSIIVIDDIYWSAEMTKAWKEICEIAPNKYTVDLYHMGIIFKHKNCVGQHFRIRY
ncbi:MAG: class I SAM-dependent methyltransferase [Salinivirgaceae bacterium]|nr:class I SAM-dependent methyltransferase [Salinivirgaceae bacterium]MDD4745662.1 class I SAM-dependent methyltransferase [Salinivirgaceae bacterium]MDY0279310.1 class I SAM-dependent methyltransferase [Salinivirgaceae bacterium]